MSVSIHSIIHPNPSEKVKDIIVAQADVKDTRDIPEWMIIRCPSCNKLVFYYDDPDVTFDDNYVQTFKGYYDLEIVASCHRVDGTVCPHCKVVISEDYSEWASGVVTFKAEIKPNSAESKTSYFTLPVDKSREARIIPDQLVNFKITFPNRSFYFCRKIIHRTTKRKSKDLYKVIIPKMIIDEMNLKLHDKINVTFGFK